MLELADDSEMVLATVGGIWSEFCSHLPTEQAKVLTKGCNIILLSEPESTLPTDIIELIIREDLEISNKKLVMYETFITAIIDILNRMGVKVNDELIEFEDLSTLTCMLDTFFEVQNYEDLIGLRELLDGAENTTEDKYVEVVYKLYKDQVEDKLHELVTEVSLNVINGLRLGVREDDRDEVTLVPKEIITRMRAKVEYIKDTPIYNHILMDGQLGGDVESYISFFGRDLEPLLENPTNDNIIQYFKILVAIYIISDVTHDKLLDSLLRRSNELIEDYELSLKVDNYIRKVIVDEDV